MKGKTQGLLRMILAYALAAAASIAYVLFGGMDHLVIEPLVADLIGTAIIFAFSVLFNNSSMYDPYWSVAPPFLAVYFFTAHPHGIYFREFVVFGLVLWWAVRLTWNFWRGWPGPSHEDWRYVNIRKKTGLLYWPVSFLGIHLFPTLLVFLGCLPFIFIFSRNNILINIYDVLGFLVMTGGILLEVFADRQLRNYTLHHKKPGETFKGGLWKWSRHPNYLGEVCFWWGIALFGMANSGVHWANFIGAGAITVLFLGISIPMIEKRMMERRPDYPDYKRQAGMLLPKKLKPRHQSTD